MADNLQSKLKEDLCCIKELTDTWRPITPGLQTWLPSSWTFKIKKLGELSLISLLKVQARIVGSTVTARSSIQDDCK